MAGHMVQGGLDVNSYFVNGSLWYGFGAGMGALLMIGGLGYSRRSKVSVKRLPQPLARNRFLVSAGS